MKIKEKLAALTKCLKEDLDISSEIVSNLEKISKAMIIFDNKKIIIQKIKEIIQKTKYSLVLYLSFVIPDILEIVSKIASQRKKIGLLLINKWDLQNYGNIIRRMKMLGNIHFRNIKRPFSYCFCLRDSKEFLFGRFSESKDDQIFVLYLDDISKAKFFLDLRSYFLELSTPIV